MWYLNNIYRCKGVWHFKVYFSNEKCVRASVGCNVTCSLPAHLSRTGDKVGEKKGTRKLMGFDKHREIAYQWLLWKNLS